MTWVGRQKGWIPRKPATAQSPISKPIPVATPVQTASVIVPDVPAFSPAAVAQLVGASRQAVYYWMTAGKLEFFRDNIGEPYVMRAELIRFIRDYLQREISI